MNFSAIKSITIPEGNVKKITANGVVLWKLKENTGRLPSEYQEVEFLRRVAYTSNGAYIDLGFAFDTGATICYTQLFDDPTWTCYPFGAAENSGSLRCLLSAPYVESVALYGSKVTSYIQVGLVAHAGFHDYRFTLKKGELDAYSLSESGRQRLTTQEEYTMGNNLYLFAQNYNGSPRWGNQVKIGKFRYYDKNDNIKCDLVPCYRKIDNVCGMYDLARGVFLTNAGGGNFIAGDVVEEKQYTNLAEPMALDWLLGYRTSSAESGITAAAGWQVTNFIGDGINTIQNRTIYFKDIKMSVQRILFYDKNKTLIYMCYPALFKNIVGFDDSATEGYVYIDGDVNALIGQAVYVRLCCLASSTKSVVTIDEVIT